MPERDSILAIRLSALGDIIHALPAIASLKLSFPSSKLALLIAPRWLPLVEGNPYIDELIPPRLSTIRRIRPVLAFDFQGLLKSAFIGRLARPLKLYGFDRSVARESLAPIFYTDAIPVTGPHRVERCLQLIAAAGASKLTQEAWIPPGRAEGTLPQKPFVLASPFAGWAGKQWPLENYNSLGELLSREGLQLIVNVPPQNVRELEACKHLRVHTSSLSGLIDATRRAAGVIGVDSGPLHIAAALRKPGVALYGPTDPRLTGPFGGSMIVLRADNSETTYKRHARIHSSMHKITSEGRCRSAFAFTRARSGAAQLTAHYLFPKRYADFVQRLRVPCGFLLLIAFAWLSQPTACSLFIGVPISVLGLLLRAWAAGHLAKDRQLATTGPYRYIRNPLYAGTLIVALGIVIASRSIWLAIIFAIIFVLIYLPAIELEEQHLREIFPEYAAYAARIRRFLPLAKWPGAQTRFSSRAVSSQPGIQGAARVSDRARVAHRKGLHSSLAVIRFGHESRRLHPVAVAVSARNSFRKA